MLAIWILSLVAPAVARDGQRDFDFEFGGWHAHLSRLVQPLSGSHTWTEYTGTSTVRKVWNGHANLGEFDVHGPAGRIHGMTLRLYNPKSGRWSIYWANASDGALTPPLVGSFKSGNGEFFDKETFNGRPILARFIISNVTLHSFRLTQSFSDDAGKTWEANWIADFSR